LAEHADAQIFRQIGANDKTTMRDSVQTQEDWAGGRITSGKHAYALKIIDE
jgi:hypothetical protein